MRRITPGIPPNALMERVYGLMGIFCPNNEKRKSQAKRAERPDAITSKACGIFSFFNANIPINIPEIIRTENKSVIVSPD